MRQKRRKRARIACRSELPASPVSKRAANDVLPRAPVALESRKRGRFDEAQLVEAIAVDVANALVVVFLVKACREQLGQRREKTRPHIAASRRRA